MEQVPYIPYERNKCPDDVVLRFFRPQVVFLFCEHLVRTVG